MTGRDSCFALFALAASTQPTYHILAARLDEEGSLLEWNVEAAAFRQWLLAHGFPTQAERVRMCYNIFLDEVTAEAMDQLHRTGNASPPSE